MPRISSSSPYICARCLQRQFLRPKRYPGTRSFTRSTVSPRASAQPAAKPEDEEDIEPEEKGAMSRRLAEMTDESIEQGGRSAQKAVEEAGFSEELKRRLEARITDGKFKNEKPAAFAQVNMPSSAGKGTRDIAAAQPWSGTETLEDAALRMLTDAHKPLRATRAPRIPQPRAPPASVDMRMRKAVQKSAGQRLANARDRTSIYALAQDSTLSEKEKEQMRKQLKERFTSGARPMPTSLQGLAALANERIEDAINRGQFKNIPRGKGTNIERDYNASSPFLDTTEYFMNKIIQKQEIVPPWIEKQQELVKAASVFRTRLRADWKRHAARVISSKGGSLESQIKRAEAYAAAEALNNPQVRKVEALSEIDHEGIISQVTVTESPTPESDTQDTKITVTEDLASESPSTSSLPPAPASPLTPLSSAIPVNPPPLTTNDKAPLAPVYPFRDPAWESTERSYLTLAIANINNLTRSYNLMAPNLAKKPYFNLDRELRSCYADVTSQLPAEIKARALAPVKVKVEVIGHRPGGVLERFQGEKSRVWDERKPQYGFKEFWRDMWGKRGD